MRLPSALLVFLSLLSPALPLRAGLVDRAAISVGPQVITESEIMQSIRLAAFQNGLLPDFSLAAQREAAQRLIDLKLVEREMSLGHYAQTAPDRARALLATFTADHFRGSAQALAIALANASLTVADLQTQLAEQADLLSFLSLRFRPAVEVSDQDIENYYGQLTGPKPALDDLRAKITELLTAQRADRDLDLWLKAQRKSTRINYLIRELQ